MKQAKKILIPLVIHLAIFSILILPSISYAVLVPCGVKEGSEILRTHPTYIQPCEFRHFMDLTNIVIRFILVDLAVPIAAIMFFYAGVLMVTSGGSTESRSKAKSIFTNTALGLVFVAGSWLIIRTILSILGYQGTWIGF